MHREALVHCESRLVIQAPECSHLYCHGVHGKRYVEVSRSKQQGFLRITEFLFSHRDPQAFQSLIRHWKRAYVSMIARKERLRDSQISFPIGDRRIRSEE